MVINILGTDYTLERCINRENTGFEEYTDGFCDETSREICVYDCKIDNGKRGFKKDLELQTRKNIRHEIVHAFLFESGLAENSDWAQNEEMVDWFAKQGPKLYAAWGEAGAI